MEARRENRRRLHVDGHRAGLAQVLLERLVVFPDAAIGGVDGAGPVVVVEVADHRRHRTLQRERRQRRHFRQLVVVRRAFTADGGNGQYQIANLVLALQPAALAEEQHGLGCDRRQQVHHRGRIRTAHAEIDHGDAVEGDARHRTIQPAHFAAANDAPEHVEITAEIGQQDMLPEFVQRHSGVSRQPVGDDFLFLFHLLLPLRIRTIVGGRRWHSQGEARTLVPLSAEVPP